MGEGVQVHKKNRRDDEINPTSNLLTRKTKILNFYPPLSQLLHLITFHLIHPVPGGQGPSDPEKKPCTEGTRGSDGSEGVQRVRKDPHGWSRGPSVTLWIVGPRGRVPRD